MKYYRSIPIRRKKDKWYLADFDATFDSLPALKAFIDDILAKEGY